MPLFPPANSGYPLGLTGATAATRYVGATSSGAPASGTFATGDFIIDRTGKVYVCTSGGSPGTWSAVGGGYWDATIRKSSDQSVTSSTTLQDDTELQFSAANSTPYQVELFISYTGSTTGDLKWQLVSTPSDGGPWQMHMGIDISGNTQFVTSNSFAVVSNGAFSSQKGVWIWGWFLGANGTFKLTWAQNTSDGTATKVKAGSTLSYRALI